MKKSKRWISAVVAAVMTCSVAAVAMVGCGKKPEPEQKVYTYNEYISRFPSSWSTHNASSDADMYVQKYTEMGLYAYSLSDDKTTFKFVDEMATGDPVNVTSTYSGRYGITAADADNTKAGKAWEITLNPDATWENGTAITADDYVWSMERVLSSEMKNKLATSYTTGETAVYNGNNYYNGGDTVNYKLYTEALTEAQIAAGIAERSLFFSLSSSPIILGKFTLQYYHDLFPRNSRFFRKDKSEDPAVRDWYAYLKDTYGDTANEYGYILLTEDNYEVIKAGMTILSENLGTKNLPDWTCALSYVFNYHEEYNLISGEKTDAEIQTLMDSGTLYFSLTSSKIVLGKLTLQEYHDMFEGRNARFFRKDKSEDPAVRDWYAYLTEQYGSTADEFGYIKVTADNFADIREGMTILSENLGTKNLPAYYNALSEFKWVENTSVPFDEVGIFKTADNKFVMVFENALSLHRVKDALTSNWLVYKAYYEEGYSQQGSLKLTSYGTTSGKYMGYGPYKLDSYETDKQLVFVRNENWYGYKSDKKNYHANEYQTDRIVCKILADQATALLEFESGNLDNVVLSANDTDKYKFSDYLLKRSGSNTWSISINSDAEKLAALESDGNGNRRILSVPEFRKAISLSIDRAYIGQNIVAGATAAYTFINDNYYYDMENDPTSVYRNTAQAKKAVLALYGIEYGEGKRYATLDDAYKSVSGYDPDSAKEAFVAAYTKAKAAGLYNDGDNIRLTVYNTSVTAKFTALVNYIQKTVNEATKGTPLQDKVTVTTAVMQNGLGDAIHNGRVEARYYSFAGDYANPNGMIANFTDSKANTTPECGFDPLTATFDVTADFNGDGEAETVTKTYDAWQKSIAAGGAYATASNDIKLEILSALEYNLLSGFRTLPLCVIADVTLRSKKVNYATENANIFVAYGGVRLMTYKYSDAEWANFCKDKNNLKYD
mgnify:CR=1 FL=1